MNRIQKDTPFRLSYFREAVLTEDNPIVLYGQWATFLW